MPKDLSLTKMEAKRLVIQGRLSQKQIAAKVGVSERTMTTWIKLYGWRKDQNARLYSGADPLMAYINFLKTEHPETYQAVVKTFNEFQELPKNAQ